MKEKDLFKINLQLFAEGEENKEESVDYKALLEKQKEAYEALLKQKEEETNKKLIEIQTELEKEKLDKMDAEKKKAYLEQKAKLEEEERFSNLVKDLEEKNNKIAEYEKVRTAGRKLSAVFTCMDSQNMGILIFVFHSREG